MNQPETQDALQADAAVAGPAKQRGIRLMKGWMAAYAIVIVAYLVHGLTGAEFVAADQVGVGRRVWQALYLEFDGQSLELDPGTALSPAARRMLESAATVGGAYAREGEEWRVADKGRATPSTFLKLYKRGRFHNLPWSSLLGLLNFAGLALLLYTFLGDPLPAFLHDCSRKVHEQLAKARAARAEAETLEAKRRELAEQLEAEHAQAMERAALDADAEREYLVAAAKRDAERLTETMKHHLDADAHAAAAQLRAAIAARVLQEAHARFAGGVDGEVQDRMVRSFARQLEGMGTHD
jgi:F-type H+-transporting ATPase subunit b